MSREGATASGAHRGERQAGNPSHANGGPRQAIASAHHAQPARNGGTSTVAGNRSRNDRDVADEWEEVEGSQNSTKRANHSYPWSSPSYPPIEVEWYQAPPMMYNLKLKMKVRSNHESARHLPLSERPDLTSSSLTASMAPLDGVYRRVSVLPAMKIAGSDYNRLKETSYATRIDCCLIEGTTLLMAIVGSTHKKQSRTWVRFVSLDLETVGMLPWVTRLQPGPMSSNPGHSHLSASYSGPSSSTSSHVQTSNSHKSSTQPPNDSYLRAIIGDDYKPAFTWQDAGHVTPPAMDALSASRLGDSSTSTAPAKHRELTDAQLLSSMVVSKQTVVFDGVNVARTDNPSIKEGNPSTTDDASSAPPHNGATSAQASNGTHTTTSSQSRGTTPSRDIPKSSSTVEPQNKQPSPDKTELKTEDLTQSTLHLSTSSLPTADLPDATPLSPTSNSTAVATEDQQATSPPSASNPDLVAHADSVTNNLKLSSASLESGSASMSSVPHLSMSMLEVNDGTSTTASTAPSGTVTPTPSTPTSTSSSYSMGLGAIRDPSEGAEFMAKDLEVRYFPVEATCLSLNRAICSLKHYDAIAGFASGQILKFDPRVNMPTEREKSEQTSWKIFNQLKTIHGGVRKLAWQSHTQFFASFGDGFLYLFNLMFEDDPDFAKEDKDPRRPKTALHKAAPPPAPSRSKKEPAPTIIADGISIPADGWISDCMWLRVHRQHGGKLYNPVGMWSISPGSAITDFAQSADLKYLATTSKDGILRIFSTERYELVVGFKSYFGGFTCLAWSPDSNYIVTGGEDDMVSLWSVNERALVARCAGHISWISKVAFDPHRCSTGSYYRFASVGQDCQVAIWEFSSETLIPPKVNVAHSRRRRSSRASVPVADAAPSLIIPPVPRDEAFRLDPIVIQRVTTSPCSELHFIGADLLVIGGWAGQVAFFLLESNELRPTTLDTHLNMVSIDAALQATSQKAETSSPSTSQPILSPQPIQARQPESIIDSHISDTHPNAPAQASSKGEEAAHQ